MDVVLVSTSRPTTDAESPVYLIDLPLVHTRDEPEPAAVVPGDVDGDVSRVRMSGPIQPFATGFCEELARLGYTDFSARAQLWLAAHLSTWMAELGLGLSALTEETVLAYLAARRAAGRTAFRSPKALGPLMRYLRQVGAIPAPTVAPPASDPVEALLGRYRRYLMGERGVTAKTAHDYTDAVRPFLSRLTVADGLALESATAATVTAFILAECRRRQVRAAQMVMTATRSLLRFLQVEGLVDSSLVSAVPKVPDRRQALARALEPEQLQALLGSCDQSAFGRRDLAILVMPARLGLRAGEVAGLRLEDIDWHRGEIVVPGKPNRCDRLPLPADVGAALAAYLRTTRPADAPDRHVFIRVLAPHGAMTATGVTQVVVARVARRGEGVPVTNPATSCPTTALTIGHSR